MAQTRDGPARAGQGADARPSSERQNQSALASDGIAAALFNASPTTLGSMLAVPALALLLRAGWSAIVLVPLCSVLLLLNPWVRAFLELPAVDQDAEDTDGQNGKDADTTGKRRIGTTRLGSLDPARFLGFLSTGDEHQAKPAQGAASGTRRDKTSPLDRSGAHAALRRMPAHLRTPLSDLEELIIRDCVSTWYNYHSFGEDSLPNEARYSIDHAIGSVYAATESIKSADVTADLLLAAASVVLVTLRYRRLYPNRAPIFSSDRARIQALREALDRVFRRHGRAEDASCDILRVLLREIISKQVWNAICGVGKPDFINQKIIEWDEKNRAKSGTATDYTPYTKSSATRVPGTAGYAAPMSQSLMAEQRKSAVQSPTTQAPSAYLDHTMASASLSPVGNPPSMQFGANAADDGGAHSSTSEPLTKQPKAMMMPSAPGRMPSMLSSPVPPAQSVASPRLSHSPRFRETHLPETSTSRRDSQQAPVPSRSKKNDGNQFMLDSMVMPMNVPANARGNMSLPESLKKSLRSEIQEGSPTRRSFDTSHDGRPPKDGRWLSADDSRGSMSAASSPKRPQLQLDPRMGSSSSTGRRGSNASSSPDLQMASPSGLAGDAHFSALQRSRPPSRTASAASGGIPPPPDLGEVLSTSPSATGVAGLRDAFEAFLERGGVANRSLFFSPPSAATVAPGEGEALLKLHVGLLAIARLVPSDAEQGGEAYRDDAASIVHKAFHTLTSSDDGIAGRPLRDALAGASNRLRVPQNKGGGKVREVLLPVETALWQRLTGLYEHFWRETCTRPSGSGAANSVGRAYSGSTTPSRGSTSHDSNERKRSSRDLHQAQGVRDGEHLGYVPRKKPSLPTIQQQKASPVQRSEKRTSPEGDVLQATPVQPVPATMTGQSIHSAEQDARESSKGPSEITRPEPRRDSMERPSGEGLRIEISLTDVSPNAERPDSIVDVKQYEAMIAVEGLLTESGGFMLLRSWKDFLQLRDDLARNGSLPKTPKPLPDPKGKKSAVFAAELETYLRELLASPEHITSEALQHFVDKARGGEGNTENRFGTLLDSMQLGKGLGIGRSLATGVGNVGRSAFNTLQMVPNGVAGVPRMAGQMATDAFGQTEGASAEGAEPLANELSHLPRGARKSRTDSTYAAERAPLQRGESEQSEGSRAKVEAAALSEMQESKPLPSTDFSQTDLDNLLSILFAIADEAFNLSGGWTFRRGMLRVFEQIVRTQYWSSLLSVFNNLANTLNEEQIGNWCVGIKSRFWPDEGGPTGTAKDAGNDFLDAVVEGTTTTGAALPVTQVPTHGTVQGNTEHAKGNTDSAAARHAQAQAILLRHVPASSAYLLGPGGRQSCERAVLCVHAAICEASTSLDLVLTVVLKLCDVIVEAR